MSTNQTIVAPSRVGPFAFRGTVGSGAFSVVKLAFHEELKQFFACKIVPRNRLSIDNLEEHFEVEIRINQQMHHPGIVQIVDLRKDDINYYIFMEFCPNGELFRYIVERQRLSESEAALLLRQVLDAINYVHSLGVAHRDLKPENLLLDPVGHLKISDFGLSRFVGRNGLVNTPCGSPCYASPECLSGHAYDGRKSDIWSIGVILFAMVTGQLPWTKRNQAQLFNQIKQGDYVIPTYLSEPCKDLIARLLTVDTNQRITMEEALKHPWLQNVQDDSSREDESFFTIVSLKTVDKFFEKVDFSSCDSETIPERLEQNASFKTINFGQVVKSITTKKGLPALKMRSRGYSVMQSLNAKHSGPVLQTPPSTASFGFMPVPYNKSSNSTTDDLNAGSTPKPTRTAPHPIVGAPKIMVPQRPVPKASWVTLK